MSMSLPESVKPDGPVLVIGASNLDVKGRPIRALEVGTSNQGFIRNSLGGVARNIAENLACLDVPTVLLSAIGGDGAGKRLLSQTAESGVNVSDVVIDPEGRTGTYVAVLDHNGGLYVSVDDMTIMKQLTPRYINDRRRLFREASMVVIDANLTSRTLKTIFRLAERYNVPVCADPTGKTLAHRLCPYLSQLLMVTPNTAEAEALLGQGPIEGRNEAIAAAKQSRSSPWPKWAFVTQRPTKVGTCPLWTSKLWT
jgi:pseudouridine kinase